MLSALNVPSPADTGQRKSRALMSVLQAEEGDEPVDALVDKIVEIAEEVLDSERVLLFFVGTARQDLFTLNCPTAASPRLPSSSPLILPLDVGIPGFVARTGRLINTSHAASHPHHDLTVDLRLGLHTRTCLCIPIVNSAGTVYAVLQAINKRRPGQDDDEDGGDYQQQPQQQQRQHGHGHREQGAEQKEAEQQAELQAEYSEDDEDIGQALCVVIGSTLRRRLTEVVMMRSRRGGEGGSKEIQSMLEIYGNSRPQSSGYERQLDRGKRRSLGTASFTSQIIASIYPPAAVGSIPEPSQLSASRSDGGGDRRATWSRTMSTPFKTRRALLAQHDLSHTADLSNNSPTAAAAAASDDDSGGIEVAKETRSVSAGSGNNSAAASGGGFGLQSGSWLTARSARGRVGRSAHFAVTATAHAQHFPLQYNTLPLQPRRLSAAQQSSVSYSAAPPVPSPQSTLSHIANGSSPAATAAVTAAASSASTSVSSSPVFTASYVSMPVNGDAASQSSSPSFRPLAAADDGAEEESSSSSWSAPSFPTSSSLSSFSGPSSSVFASYGTGPLNSSSNAVDSFSTLAPVAAAAAELMSGSSLSASMQQPAAAAPWSAFNSARDGGSEENGSNGSSHASSTSLLSSMGSSPTSSFSLAASAAPTRRDSQESTASRVAAERTRSASSSLLSSQRRSAAPVSPLTGSPLPSPAAFSLSLSWPVLAAVALPDASSLCSLSFNPFEWSDDALLHCCFVMLQELELTRHFSISLPVLQSFLLAVRSKYRSNPYHNFYHAFSVMQFAYYTVRVTEAGESLPKLDLLALLVSCLCHDIDHPGTTNTFQVLVASELALLHNDQAVLENHHAATTFSLLSSPSTSIISPLNSSLCQADCRALRKMIITAILSTDMARHFDMCHDLDSQEPECQSINWRSDADRQFVINLITHSSDLSGQITPLHIALQWEERVTLEFMRQSALEQQCGLPLTSYFKDLHVDRIRLKNHINFLDFVMTPLWTGLVELFPPMRACAENLVRNRKFFMDKMREEEGKAVAASAAAATAGLDDHSAAAASASCHSSTACNGSEGDGGEDEAASSVYLGYEVVRIHGRSRCSSVNEEDAAEEPPASLPPIPESTRSSLSKADAAALYRPLHATFDASASPPQSRSPSTPSTPARSEHSSPQMSSRASRAPSAVISTATSPQLRASHLSPLAISINTVPEDAQPSPPTSSFGSPEHSPASSSAFMLSSASPGSYSGSASPANPSSHSQTFSLTAELGSSCGGVRRPESIKDRRESRWGDQLVSSAASQQQQQHSLSPASSTASLSPASPPAPSPLLLSPFLSASNSNGHHLGATGEQRKKISIGERRVSVIQTLQQGAGGAAGGAAASSTGTTSGGHHTHQS